MAHPDLDRERVVVALATCSDDLVETLLDCLKKIAPGRKLYVIAEHQPPEGEWILYHPRRTTEQNLARIRDLLKDKEIEWSAIVLQPRMPYWALRGIGVRLAPGRVLVFNENLDHFRLHPRSLPQMARHILWRARNWWVWETRPGGWWYTQVWRLFHPRAYRRPVLWRLAKLAGKAVAKRKAQEARLAPASAECHAPGGVTVVIPTRDGRRLLETLLPGLLQNLEGIASEVRIIDNGSTDGTAEWLRHAYPSLIVEEEKDALPFAVAVNRGCRAAQFAYVCLLNNDMILEPGFFRPLFHAFDQVPDLFCATAQILFPAGVRREETGKAMWAHDRHAVDFPVWCEEPIEGEDLTYVLYGSGGCSMYDAGKLRAVGCFGEVFRPAYCEDLDVGYRGWQRGWPTVFAAGARVTHFHRSTTTRYYSTTQIQTAIETNYLRFLARSVAEPEAFWRHWEAALWRLNLIAASEPPPPYIVEVMRAATRARNWPETGPPPVLSDAQILAAGSRESAVFPGRARTGKPVVLIASPYLPFPLSHGGAVRMFNLMREAARDFGQVLVAFSDELRTPPRELLDLCEEVVVVRRRGSHLLPMTERPEVVEEFDSGPFRAMLGEMIRKWRPGLAQLEFTQMAQYAGACHGLPTLLVEHDVTMDLYGQLLAKQESWELRRQYERWVTFERRAWQEVTRVAAMSERDRGLITEGQVVVLPNGVDLNRFQPEPADTEENRILFIGSFAHLPNVMAVEFFLREVWPGLKNEGAVFHVIAGSRHEYFLDLYKDRVKVDLKHAGIEVEDFVADVRPAYRRAAVVVAPLPASAGTNIKIFEAMAMGKAIVATPAGINGLDFTSGEAVVVAQSGAEMAAAVRQLLKDREYRKKLGASARALAERDWGWPQIGQRQRALYEELYKRRAEMA